MKERELEPKKIELKEMPSKEVLEAFLNGMHGKVTVIFNTEEGKFEEVRDDGND
jgi:arsenate reductase-like glutaredoxin family protein